MTAKRACIASQPLPTVVIELGRLLERRLHCEVTAHEMTANQFIALMRMRTAPESAELT